MQMQRSAMSGCCVGTYYYDLGGAHGKHRAKNIEEFAIRLLDIGMNQINIAVTNPEQTPERKFLEELGFKEVFRDGEGKGRMHVHAADSAKLTKALEPYRAAKQKAYEEEQRKKREAAEKARLEAQKKAEEQAKKKAEDLRKKQEEAKKLLTNVTRITSTSAVTLKELQDMYNTYPSLPVNVIMNAYFGFKLDGQFAFPDYERKWNDEALLRSVNSRLRKRAAQGVEAV